MPEVGTWLGPGQIRFNGDITRNGLSDFLMGHAGSFRQNNGNNRFFRNRNWHAFMQDDWKVHSRVTLNLSNPNLVLSNQNVGRILGAGAARVVQFGLKYTF